MSEKIDDMFGSRIFLLDKLPGLSKSLKNEIIIRDVK